MNIEKQPNQPLQLTPEAKDRIGNFNLALQLDNKANQDRYLYRSTFTQKHLNSIFYTIGSEIPDDLIDKFDLKNLDWFIFAPDVDTLPILFLGKDVSNELTSNGFKDSLSTIEIARRIEFNHGEEEKVPFYLRIAGVNKEQNRIVAVTYDLTENNRLIKANISIPNEEFDEKNNIKMLSLLSKALVPLQFSEERPYLTAALITPQMRKSLKTDNLRESEHEWAFSFNLSEYAISLYRPHVRPRDPSIPLIFHELGYYSKRDKNGFVKIGLEADAAKKRGIKPWEISIPESLQKP